MASRCRTSDSCSARSTRVPARWSRLVRRAPLGSGVAQSADLLEAPRRLVDEAWNEFAGELLEADAQALSDYEELVTRIGDFSTDRLLRNFLDKRAEWWSFGGADPVQ